MLYEISNELLKVKVNELGAEVSSVIFCGKERVWQNDNGSWAGKSPVLFPVCGNSKVIVNGEDKKMPAHGFARKSLFKCVSAGKDRVSFLLKSDEGTFALFPFEFEFKITYSLNGSSLVAVHEVKNTGAAPMPFAFGRHDSFAFDKDVGNYKLRFEKGEVFSSLIHDDTGRLTGEKKDFGAGREFILPEDFLVNGNTVIFGGIGSRRVTLMTVDNVPLADISFGETDDLLLWRPVGAKMICVEPWSALPDDDSGNVVEFAEKRGYTVLKPGESKRSVFEIKYY